MADSLLPKTLDYTDKDFDALRARIFNLISSVFPDWTETAEANFGNILAELSPFIGDVLGYYQDNQANESRFTKAKLRRSLLAFAKLIIYQARGASAATVDMTFSLAQIPVGSVTIEVGDRFSTLDNENPQSFQALEQVVIAAAANPPVVIFSIENSDNSEEVFQSSGLPNQTFLLNDTPFIDGSLVLSAANGDYEVVADLLDSSATEKHLTVTVDENNRARIRFGNAVNGAIPVGTITARYKTGGGIAGRVDAGKIRRALKSYTDEFGNPVQVSVTNELKASGGDDRETVEAIRANAPRSLRALTRSVKREDFEIHAEKISGVSRTLMLTRDEQPSIAENRGRLTVIPSGGGAPSQLLKDAVLEQITATFPPPVTWRTDVVDPVYVTVAGFVRLYLVKQSNETAAQRRVRAAQTAAAIRTNLTKFFALTTADGARNEEIDFGFRMDGTLAFSDIYNVVRDTTNVRRIGDEPGDFLLNDKPSDVDLKPFEFPALGTFVLIDGDTGLPLGE